MRFERLSYTALVPRGISLIRNREIIELLYSYIVMMDFRILGTTREFVLVSPR